MTFEGRNRLYYLHYVQEGMEPRDREPVAAVILWCKYPEREEGRWGLFTEYYVEYGYTKEIPIKREHLLFILKEFRLPSDFLPLRAIRTMSPQRLECLASAISELGGEDKVRSFLSHVGRQGIRIQTYLGGGGWGHVFRAYRPDLKQSVALKILKPPYDDEWRRRFQEESSILQALSQYRGIAGLIEPIQELDDLLFIQTRYVRGIPLSNIRIPTDCDTAIELIRKVLQVLRIPHNYKQGIVHRDLHLGNVMQANGGHVVLVDFGLAREEGGLEYYKTFKPVGAMSHCAPEKWRDPSTAGKPSDIFSVGVMFYRLLSGSYPFWADTYIGLYEQIKEGKFDPVSWRMKSIKPPDIDLLQLVIEEMLDPSPDRRLQDASAALTLLRGIEPARRLYHRRRRT